MSQSEATPAQEILDRVIVDMGGAVRQGQREMTARVESAVQEGSVLLVQAGTGTGKSIGYLTPLGLWSATTGASALVSTSTLALQRQIITKDAPRVISAVREATGRQLRVKVLKGWQNYLCKRKLEGGYPDQGPDLFDAARSGSSGISQLGAEVLKLRKWAAQTTTGDRDDLEPGVSNRAWAQVSLPKPHCIASKCPFYETCYPRLAQDEALEADLVVTNHTLLALGTSGSARLPDYGALVIDEAHDLSASFTRAHAVELSTRAINRVTKTLAGQGVTDMDLENGGRVLEQWLQDTPEGRVRTVGDERVLDALNLMIQGTKNAASALRDAGGKSAESKRQARGMLEELREVCSTIRGADLTKVNWVSTEMRSDSKTLNCAPLDVAKILAQSLLDDDSGVVFTSATLTLGNSFEPLAREMGVSLLQDRPWSGVDVGSPFEFDKQGILYVARSLPDPGREWPDESALVEVEELIEASGGGALGLFSSWRAAEAATKYLRENTKYKILMQGEDTVTNLVDQFLTTPDSCLVGTRSLWQGIDAPGSACRLVIIDRIPFPRPDEPLSRARSEAADAAGRNGFWEVSVNQAAMLMAQGAGRLIRTSADRGVVAILDRRVATRSYGNFIADSMPPMWRTGDGETVRGALARIASSEK